MGSPMAQNLIKAGYADISTVDGATLKLISGHIKATLLQLYSYAPVSGSEKPAEDRQLIFLTAGDKPLYDKVAPFLDIMGKVLPRGSWKQSCNEACRQHDHGQCTNVLNEGPFDDQVSLPYSISLETSAEGYETELGLAESVSQSTLLQSLPTNFYKVAKSYGLSDEDFSEVIEALKAKRSQNSSA